MRRAMLLLALAAGTPVPQPIPQPVPQPHPVPHPHHGHEAEEDLRLSELSDLTKPDLWQLGTQRVSMPGRSAITNQYRIDSYKLDYVSDGVWVYQSYHYHAYKSYIYIYINVITQYVIRIVS